MSPSNENESPIEYFRRDQRDGISPPDPSKECSYAEHIVRARGKRTKFTSVSLDPDKIRDFGDTLYRFKQDNAAADGHHLVEHVVLIRELRRVISEDEKHERARAIQALRYATARKEGLVSWSFSTAGIDRKDLISWATTKVQSYFSKV